MKLTMNNLVGDHIRGNGRRKAIRGPFMTGRISPSRTSWWAWVRVPSGWASLTLPKPVRPR